MQTTMLGRTDLEVSRICLGTWQFSGSFGDINRDDAQAAVKRARELGINFFDTAQAYGFGAAETLLAEALAEVPREQVIIATKGGLRSADGVMVRDSSPGWLRAGLEASLRHLDTDYIDLYQVHWPDRSTPMEQTAATLQEFVDEGKVRYVGASNFDLPELVDFERTRKLDSLQPPYHLLRREIEDEVLPYCLEHGVGVLIYAPLAHGLLSGRFTRETTMADNDWRSRSDVFSGDGYDRNLEVVAALSALAGEHGLTVAELAIAWTLSNPAVDVAIVGARHAGHVEQSAPAGDVQLDPLMLESIENILTGAVPVGGPVPML
jgi:aryl-alcohol dehydrogenase-like predicted oxidoreductase